MKKFLVNSLAVVFLSFMAIGCGGGGGGSTASTVDPNALSQTSVSTLKFVDVKNKPLVGAKIDIGSPTASTKSAKATYTVGEDGTVDITELSAGTYQITITIGGVEATAVLKISDTNFQETASVMAGVELLANGEVNLIEGYIIASISGSVTTTTGVPIHLAQVSVSGGTTTNGSFASALTDANGGYILFVNVNQDLITSLPSLSITASASGYQSVSYSSTDVIQNISLSGLNFQLGVLADTSIYNETFDGDISGWTKNKLSGTNDNNMWHQHTSSVTGVNKAFTDGVVSLAPNDTSKGNVPAPKSGKSMWYGNGVVSDDTFGNFIGVYGYKEALNGGTSDGANSGELISPTIDLTGKSGAVHLTFDTWWEIESVNPNNNGYDIMTISVSTDSGSTWKTLARLNPLSDPAGEENRAPLPFSNTGFNSAPAWLSQEGIGLVDTEGNSVAGKSIKLKFTFETRDGLYNGFRGWLIDNVKIKEGEGTFPAFDETFDHPEYTYKPTRR